MSGFGIGGEQQGKIRLSIGLDPSLPFAEHSQTGLPIVGAIGPKRRLGLFTAMVVGQPPTFVAVTPQAHKISSTVDIVPALQRHPIAGRSALCRETLRHIINTRYSRCIDSLFQKVETTNDCA